MSYNTYLFFLLSTLCTLVTNFNNVLMLVTFLHGFWVGWCYYVVAVCFIMMTGTVMMMMMMIMLVEICCRCCCSYCSLSIYVCKNIQVYYVHTWGVFAIFLFIIKHIFIIRQSLKYVHVLYVLRGHAKREGKIIIIMVYNVETDSCGVLSIHS